MLHVRGSLPGSWQQLPQQREAGVVGGLRYCHPKHPTERKQQQQSCTRGAGTEGALEEERCLPPATATVTTHFSY